MVGDIVVVQDKDLPRNMWRLGRVTKVLPDDRGLVRIAEVKTGDSVIKRPVTKLVLLVEADDTEVTAR